jgi:hypothetical protein
MLDRGLHFFRSNQTKVHYPQRHGAEHLAWIYFLPLTHTMAYSSCPQASHSTAPTRANHNFRPSIRTIRKKRILKETHRNFKDLAWIRSPRQRSLVFDTSLQVLQVTEGKACVQNMKSNSIHVADLFLNCFLSESFSFPSHNSVPSRDAIVHRNSKRSNVIIGL